MWLTGKFAPDFKTIADFPRLQHQTRHRPPRFAEAHGSDAALNRRASALRCSITKRRFQTASTNSRRSRSRGLCRKAERQVIQRRLLRILLW